MRKIIFILLILTATRTLISCCKDVDYNFQWSKANLTNINFSTSETAVLTRDSTKIESYGFRLSLDEEKVAHRYVPNFGVTSTYALKCVATPHNKDAVTSIVVRTRNALDNTHPAGSSIADYLITRPGNYYFRPSTDTYKQISDNIPYLNTEEENDNNLLDFKFKSFTPFLGPHQFIINISFRSGRLLSDTTSIKLY